MRTPLLSCLLFIAVLVGAESAPAVIIASGDGTGNTSAPSDDPGWDHVGKMGPLTGIYIGNGWLLSARHVGLRDIELGGVLYRTIDDSLTQIDAGNGADLMMLRIESDPGLPDMPIASSAPSGTLTLIGQGRNRGNPVEIGDGDPELDGWDWGLGRAVRWGTNATGSTSLLVNNGYLTVMFTTSFSEVGQTHEAQAAGGDSGGGVFRKQGATWQLTGIMNAASTSGSALFGDLTYSAQLANYRNEILAVRSDIACDNGIDDDGDGEVDFPDDPGCLDANDPFERIDSLPCDDGFDDDGDGAVDYPEDVGCGAPGSAQEDSQCSDGLDNDGDGGIDWDGGAWINGGVPLGPADVHCATGADNREKSNASCGLGFELTFLLPALAALRRRLRPGQLTA
jgi:hypothetical protein